MFLQILLASLFGSVCALAGGALLLWREQFARKISLVLVSFAIGSLTGAAFLELIPEALSGASYATVAPWIVIGVLAIALAWGAGTETGIATTLAVFFHEVPQEIGDFGILIHLGYTRAKVFFY